MLYTTLPPNIASIILDKLQLDSYFPTDNRRFCELNSDDDQKHAIEVDQDTRRVIIITPTHDDHTYEDDKYFLVLRPKTEEMNYLKNTLKMLKHFIDENHDVNVLH